MKACLICISLVNNVLLCDHLESKTNNTLTFSQSDSLETDEFAYFLFITLKDVCENTLAEAHVTQQIH